MKSVRKYPSDYPEITQLPDLIGKQLVFLFDSFPLFDDVDCGYRRNGGKSQEIKGTGGFFLLFVAAGFGHDLRFLNL